MAKLSVRWISALIRRSQQAEQRAFFGVVGAGRVAGGRPDAAVVLGDQGVLSSVSSGA
jgi:hypothetical protein